MSPHLLGHLANLVFAAAYLVRNADRLRVLSILGCLLAACFQYAAPAEPLWTGIGWNLFFALLNTFNLLRPRMSRLVNANRNRLRNSLRRARRRRDNRAMRIAALLLLAVSAHAENKAVPYLKRGRVHLQNARDVVAKADASNRPAVRHAFLGRARQLNNRAYDMVLSAQRTMTADNRNAVLAFRREVLTLRRRIEKGRRAFTAPTDMKAQPIAPAPATPTIKKQRTRLRELQRERRRTIDTSANRKRADRRAELNRWRAERMRQRLQNGHR